MSDRHRLPPGPKGGYVKGGRPVKPRSAKERNDGAWRTIVGGFVVYTLKGRSLLFTRGETPLYTRFVAEVPNHIGIEYGVLETWATAALLCKKSSDEGQGPIGKQLREVYRLNEQARIKKFLSQFWPARSRNKKG